MILDSKIPGGSIEEKWTKHKFELKLVNPANKRVLALPVLLPLHPSPNLVTMSSLSASRIAPVAHTPLLPRVVSTLPRTTRTTATPFTVCSTIP